MISGATPPAPSRERKARVAERSGAAGLALRGAGMQEGRLLGLLACWLTDRFSGSSELFPRGTLRFQKTQLAGLVIFSAGHVVALQDSRAQRGVKGRVLRFLLEFRRHPPWTARGARRQPHGRRRKRPDQWTPPGWFFWNTDWCILCSFFEGTIRVNRQWPDSQHAK